VALEDDVALSAVAEDRGDLTLIGLGKQAVLHHVGDDIDLAAVHIVIARHQQQPVMRQRLGGLGDEHWPERLVQPVPGQPVLLGAPRKGQVAGEDHQVRHPAGRDLAGDEAGKVM
jgi:hypothetical protein